MEIKFKNVKKKYKDGKSTLIALKETNLTINTGELVAIVGPSGSGKSTILQLIGGLLTPSSGLYHLDGLDVAKFSENRKAQLRNEAFGFIVQNFGLISDYTVYENLIQPLKYNKETNRRSFVEKVQKVLQSVDLEEKKDNYIHDLSGGQKQRVAIARAFINDPAIILADEPTGSLDDANSQKIIELLLKFNKRNRTVIIVTHDMKIANLCSRIIRIEDGKIVE